MSTFANALRTFLAGEDLEKYRFVKIDSTVQDQILFADAGQEPVGVTDEARDSGQNITVALMSKPGTMHVRMSGTVSYGDALYVAADGQASTVVAGRQRGTALEAGVNLAVIEMMPVSDVSPLNSSASVELFDEFQFFTDATNDWTVTADAGGSQDVIDAVNGVLELGCDGDDNDEAYIKQTHQTFQFQANKRILAKVRMKLAEAATDDSNIIFGLTDTASADFLLDNGGGPAASYDGFSVFKVDGGTVWQAEASNAGTQTNIDLTGGADDFDDDTFVEFLIEFIPTSATVATVNVYKDGILLGTITAWAFPAGEMSVIAGVKAGGANEEDLEIDFIQVGADR